MRHHRPGARFWARPLVFPPPCYGALRAWTWVEAEWEMLINGVYCYGDGYFYDGYNYYYNGACYTTPPVLTAVVPQTVDDYW